MRKFIVRAGGVGTGLSKSTVRRIKENDQLGQRLDARMKVALMPAEHRN
jgi:hypothetical protein